ncbi:DUF916 domain-containing protein [Pseudonocardiaceae bacterium YIM PH 21723]|nr:DUF916 domain-containing protein [Pseudonocardiaceae bacterium YIM PH 21723]
MSRVLVSVLAAVLAMGVLSPAAMAQPSPPDKKPPVSFGVRPANAAGPDSRTQFTYTATPGGVFHDFISVENISDQPLRLRVDASDAFNTPEGGFDLRARGVQNTDIGLWIKSGKDEIEVQPKSKVTVPFDIQVPANAGPGDHTGGVVASLTTQQTSADGSKVAVDQRVGSRVYMRVTGELKPQLTVERFDGTYRHSWNPFGSGSAEVGYTVRNTGNVRLAADQRLRVETPVSDGTEITGLPKVPELLPGNEFTLRRSVDGVGPWFFLTGRVHLDPIAPKGLQTPTLRPVNASTDFEAMPWSQLIILLTLVIAVLLYLRLRRPSTVEAPDA